MNNINNINNIVYVNNLRQISDLSEIADLFSLVGDVGEKQFEIHQQSISGAGFGSFMMASDQQAADCIERYHGTAALGQTLCVTALKPLCRIKPVAPVKKGRRKL